MRIISKKDCPIYQQSLSSFFMKTMSIVQSMATQCWYRFAMIVYLVPIMCQPYLVAILQVAVLWVLYRKVSKS